MFQANLEKHALALLSQRTFPLRALQKFSNDQGHWCSRGCFNKAGTLKTGWCSLFEMLLSIETGVPSLALCFVWPSTATPKKGGALQYDQACHLEGGSEKKTATERKRERGTKALVVDLGSSLPV